jgi:hypothetical protein
MFCNLNLQPFMIIKRADHIQMRHAMHSVKAGGVLTGKKG